MTVIVAALALAPVSTQQQTTPELPFESVPNPLTMPNDIHFGEIECGRIDDHPEGPIQRAAPGEDPYPVTMNRGAIAEMAAINPAAVFVKGDLSNDGQPDEWAAFEAHYRPAFTDRLRVVRGNHDAYRGQVAYDGDHWVDLPGLSVALLDTVIPGKTTGTLSQHQLDWLDAHAAVADRPVLVMGHHQQWMAPASGGSSDGGGRSDDLGRAIGHFKTFFADFGRSQSARDR